MDLRTIEIIDMYRYALVVIDKFSKFGWTVSLKNKNAPTLKNFIENILITSKRKSNLLETNAGGKFVYKIFTDFLNKINIERHSRNNSLGAVFAKCFSRTIRNLLKKPVFEQDDANCFQIPPTITKH